MGDFEAASKHLALIVCPHCGEMRQLELHGAWWHCDVCSKKFPAATPTVAGGTFDPGCNAVAHENASPPGPEPKPVGFFKVLQR